MRATKKKVKPASVVREPEWMMDYEARLRRAPPEPLRIRAVTQPKECRETGCTEATSRHMRRGAYSYCDLHKFLRKNTGALYEQYRKAAADRGRAFELSIKQFHDLVWSDCSYCGGHNDNHHNVGIDRVDNDEGYVEGNVVSCCWRCNRMKGARGAEEFLGHAQKIMEYQGRALLEAADDIVDAARGQDHDSGCQCRVCESLHAYDAAIRSADQSAKRNVKVDLEEEE